jgi:fructose-1,6-bisphosphatase/inositol monophosphatase family enzyme
LLDRGAEITLIVDPIDATGNATAAAELTLSLPPERLHRMPRQIPPHSAQYGFPFYAFSVGALAGDRLVAACVRNLPTGDLFTAVRSQGSRLNGIPVHCEPVRELANASIALVRSADPEGIRRFIPFAQRSARIRITGCTSLDMCLIASGTMHGFANPNTHRPRGYGEKVVDYAGALLILEEAGGFASDGDGQPLSLALDLSARTMPFAAGTLELLHEMREVVRVAGESEESSTATSG